MPDSQAKTKWDKENTVRITVKFNRNTDADIIWKLETLSNVSEYIKKVIRKDIRR